MFILVSVLATLGLPTTFVDRAYCLLLNSCFCFAYDSLEKKSLCSIATKFHPDLIFCDHKIFLCDHKILATDYQVIRAGIKK